MSDEIFYNVLTSPFSVHGLLFNGSCFLRLPEDVAERTNEGVKGLNFNTAGGRVRFVTDSPFVRIKADFNGLGKMEHFAYTGSAGFDLYTGKKEKCRYEGTFVPHFDSDSMEAQVDVPGTGEKLITINLPTYSGVKNLFVGLDKNAVLKPAPAYEITTPVVFYGSSITQGGCCSRPGNTYQAILSRRLDFDYINLGFSGSAKGEDAIAEYMAGLTMSAFVLDYDHNAPTPEHLNNTHEKLFKTIRKAHPDLPILILTRPKFHLTEEEQERKRIAANTYLNAMVSGDRNVYYIPGNWLIQKDCIECATVDNCHPDDAGFLCMANAMEAILQLMIFE